jgi:hypothetical protein
MAGETWWPDQDERISQDFSAVASADVAVPSSWTVYRAIWSIQVSASGGNLTARASGGAVTRQHDHATNNAGSHIITNGRIGFAGASAPLMCSGEYDVSSGTLVATGMLACDDGSTALSTWGVYHSSLPTSIGVGITAGTITGSVIVERIV